MFFESELKGRAFDADLDEADTDSMEAVEIVLDLAYVLTLETISSLNEEESLFRSNASTITGVVTIDVTVGLEKERRDSAMESFRAGIVALRLRDSVELGRELDAV